MPTGPGLAKGRRPSLVSVRETARVKTTDIAWKDVLAKADAVSEGAPRTEAHGDVWYGSTSLILRLEAKTEAERTFLAAVAARDLHVRTRALRLAVREATVRAGTTLGRSQCEVRFAVDPAGVRIDVDVQAPFIGSPRRASRSSP